MELFQYVLEFLRDRESQMCSVLQEAYALIGEVKKDNSGTKDRSCPDDLCVEYMPNAHQHEDDHLLADAFKANAAVQLPVLDSTHDAGDIIHRNKHDKGKEQAITSSEKVPQPPPDRCKYELNKVPELFHVAPPLHKKWHPAGCL